MKKISNKNVPLEWRELETLKNYLQLARIRFTHIPNDTYTTSGVRKRMNQRVGVSKGFPDFMIFLDDCILFIEMKRVDRRLSRVTPQQREWIDYLNTLPYCYARVCYGFDEARQFINEKMIDDDIY